MADQADQLRVYDADALPWVSHPTIPNLELRIFENLTSSVGYDALLVRVAPSGMIDWHVHALAAETIYVVEGSGLIYGVSDESEQADAMGIPLRLGAVATVRAGWRHKVLNAGAHSLILFAFHSPATL